MQDLKNDRLFVAGRGLIFHGMKKAMFQLPTAEELYALEKRARRERALHVAALFSSLKAGFTSGCTRPSLQRWYAMRNEIVTPFWKNALASLPASVRGRYAADIAAAERWELRIDAAVKGLTRARSAFSRTIQAA
jgi:hypothetical protein